MTITNFHRGWQRPRSTVVVVEAVVPLVAYVHTLVSGTCHRHQEETPFGSGWVALGSAFNAIQTRKVINRVDGKKVEAYSPPRMSLAGTKAGIDSRYVQYVQYVQYAVARCKDEAKHAERKKWSVVRQALMV